MTDHRSSRLALRQVHLREIIRHAQETNPQECCGLVGGTEDGRAESIYRLTNVAPNTEVAYEAAPEQLFAAQRQMRERGETLLCIYHSHPRASEPTPSDTDVRSAFYPSAIYLIVGLAGIEPAVRAFTISEQDHSWQPVEYHMSGE